MIEKLIRLIRKTLIANSGVNSLVAQRVYPRHISSITDPVLPCITLHYEQEIPSRPSANIGWKILLIQFWSDQFQQDVYPISEAVYDVLHHQRLEDTDHYVFCHQGMDEGVLTDKSDDKTRYYQSVYYRFFSIPRN